MVIFDDVGNILALLQNSFSALGPRPWFCVVTMLVIADFIGVYAWAMALLYAQRRGQEQFVRSRHWEHHQNDSNDVDV